MPINRIKDRTGRARFEFEFSRRVGGRRIRTRKLLPASWTRSQADAFDREQSAHLYAQLTGGEPARHTIGQAVAHYLDERIDALKSGRGIAQELRLMLPWYAGRDLGELPEVCAKYLADKRAELAPATLRNRLRYLTSACSYGWKHHSMGANDPAARVVMPAVSNQRQIYIDRAQMLRLARACDNWETRALIRIAFYSGMRLGEILTAEVADGCFVLPDSKNGDPVRIPIHRKIACLTGYVWPTRFMVAYWFAKTREKVGMPTLRFHDIRHSTASDLINRGVDLYTVGAVLRHKSHASTSRYAHLSTGRIAAAIGQIGAKKLA